MSQKIMETIYRLTDGKSLKEIPAKTLRTSCRFATMDTLSKQLVDLEARGYLNTLKKVVDGAPEILTVEMTTYGKSITQNLLERDPFPKKLK